jgi:hypothetical protein
MLKMECLDKNYNVLRWFRFSARAIEAMVRLFVFVNGVSFANCARNPEDVPAVLTLHRQSTLRSLL